MIHGEDGAVAWLGESARVGKRYRGRKILSRIGEGKLYWERGRWQQRGSLLRPWSSCRGWCPDCPRRGKWTEVENRRAARIPRIPSSAHSERPRQFPFHTFVISKIHKIYKKKLRGRDTGVASGGVQRVSVRTFVEKTGQNHK